MISIKDDIVHITDIEALLGRDRLESIFGALNFIWSSAAKFDYARGEKLSAQFEKLILEIDPDVYNILIEKCSAETTVKNVLNSESYCLIIMDGMSLREANFLLDDLKLIGDVQYKHALSALPSETKFFTMKNFGAKAPSQIKSEWFDYHHIQRIDQVEEIPDESKRLVIWSTSPDQIFSEFKSSFQTEDLRRVGEMSKKMLFKLLERLSDCEEIIITSDHGYFVDTFSWAGLDDFPSDERFAERVPDSILKYCKRADDYYLLYGRYNSIKRGKYVHVRHGGLSLLECITPYIVINKKEGVKNNIH